MDRMLWGSDRYYNPGQMVLEGWLCLEFSSPDAPSWFDLTTLIRTLDWFASTILAGFDHHPLKKLNLL